MNEKEKTKQIEIGDKVTNGDGYEGEVIGIVEITGSIKIEYPNGRRDTWNKDYVKKVKELQPQESKEIPKKEKSEENQEIEDVPKEEIEKTLKEGKGEQEYLDLSKPSQNKETQKGIPKSKEEIKEPKEIPDKTIEINIPKESVKPIKPVKPESKPFDEPTFPQGHSKLPTPPEEPTKEKKNKLWLIVKITVIALLLILLATSIYVFHKKDFSTDVNVTNNAPDIPVTNIYNHTIENNNTIIIQIDEDIINEIADRILNELNITNSS